MSEPISQIAMFDAAAVRQAISIPAAVPVMREAMIALSTGQVAQNLRSFISLGEGRTFAIMPASIAGQGFGAKLVSVYALPGQPKRHEGLVVLFDPETGTPLCVADAGEVTAIRTPAASAAATDVLARPDADTLAILGLGLQALGHIEAIAAVRSLRAAWVWGRDLAKAAAFAEIAERRFSLPVRAVAGARAAVEDAAIVCTVTGSSEPVLEGAWLAPGTHVNLVGSSGPGAAEADSDLVTRAQFFADHREHVLAHGGEFLRAKQAGRVDDDHILAEIGAVLAGLHPGRTDADAITVYKSLGHAVQDLALTAAVLSSSRPGGTADAHG